MTKATVAQTIAPGSDYVEIDGARKHIMTYLADFLFPPERARAPVKALSGGERNRLLLARLFSQTANMLVLDEPTNDLDIDTLELLESLLQDYPGTVLLVSHDRAFLDNVVTDTIAPEGGGRWVRNPGGYSDWKRLTEERAQALATTGNRREAGPPARTFRAAALTQAGLQSGQGTRDDALRASRRWKRNRRRSVQGSPIRRCIARHPTT